MLKRSIPYRRHFFKQFRAVPALPDPLSTFEEFLEFQNIDISELDDLELYREGLRTKQRLVVLDLESILFIDGRGNPVAAGDWLLQRLAAIRGEKQRRGWGKTDEFCFK